MRVRSFLRNAYLVSRRLALWPFALQRRRVSIPDPCRKILVVRIDRIGDLVLTTPFLRNLRESFPGAEIVLLGRCFAREILAGSKLTDRIWALDDPSDAQRVSGLAGERFDLALDLHHDYILRPAILTRRARAACSVGFDLAGRGVLFDIAVPGFERKHFVDESLDLLRALGHKPKRYPPEIHLPPDAEESARRLLANHGVRKPYVVIHPGGYYPEQRWPAARFTALAQLIRNLGFQPVILGSRTDQLLINEMTKGMPEPPAVICGAPLGVSAAVIGGSRLFVGNNSGPLHIACALNVPSVSTMGPTDPVRFWPVSGHAQVLRANTVKDIPLNDLAVAVKTALS